MSLIKNLIKHYWVILTFLPVALYMYYFNAFDESIAKDLLLRKTAISLYAILLAYFIRRTIIGYIEWQGVWKNVYAIVIHIVVGLAVIFG